jgi:hypothetical protein
VGNSVKIKDYAELKKRWESEVKAALPGRNWHFMYMEKPEAVFN